MKDKPILLAVDDTPANLDLLNGILRDDYKVKIATNGAKALELAAKDPQPDIILLDVMMPDMDGYEVCRRLKMDPSTESIPVIFVTAKAEVQDEQQGLQLGAVDYVTKPFHQDIVLARVKRHLDSHRRTRDLLKENQELQSGNNSAFRNFSEDSLQALIASGEGDRLEFKSTLRWNLHTDKTDKKIENSCLKTVAGYLNSEGGVLLVGVNDDGLPIGLNQDGFKSEDRLVLHWINLIKSYLGAEFVHWIRTTSHTVNNERILAVECLPAGKPVFLRRDNEEAFFVRMTNATQAFKTSEVIAYIEQRFSDQPDAEHRSDPQANEVDITGSDLTISGWFHQLQQRRVIRTAAIYVVFA
jgi:CheY-like chemotaxis protein